MGCSALLCYTGLLLCFFCCMLILLDIVLVATAAPSAAVAADVAAGCSFGLLHASSSVLSQSQLQQQN